MDPSYYRANKIANIMTPAIGCIASIPGSAALIVHASRYGDSWHIVSFSIYCASLVVSYAAFMLYHIFKFSKHWGKVFKILDHSTIYILIAGTYTPFTLVSLRGNWGWTLFSTVWGVTILGVFFKIYFIHRFKVMAPLIYLFIGWLIVFAIKPAIELIPEESLWLLLYGGLFYSFGLIFYAWKRLLFHHAIWHLFVLAGSCCHFFAVYNLVLPGRAI